MSDETPETPDTEADEAGVRPELAEPEASEERGAANLPQVDVEPEPSAAETTAAQSGAPDEAGAETLDAAAAGAAAPVIAGYRVTLPAFEGPLDLLLHLIEEHELDIFDIPIAFIASKFVEYITLMEQLNIDVASEYLVMAATLAHIKSKQLLPVVPDDQEDEQEPELDPRAELVRRLLEYQKYKNVAEQLAGAPVLGRDVFLRGVSAPEAEGPAQLTGLSLFKLLDAFQIVLARVKATVDHHIDLERFSITDRINQLSEVLARGGRMAFIDLFDGQNTRADLIITFLALLEMTRLRLTRLFQDGPLAPIEVELAVSPDELGADAMDETPAGDEDRNE
jgi:segregation and condensation protein A